MLIQKSVDKDLDKEIYNISTLLGDIKYICTSFRNR